MSLRYIDLSKINFLTGEKTKQNTANCYVIKKPGKYKFPIVYGNSIKNGEDNKKSYEGFFEEIIANSTPIKQPEIIHSGYNHREFSLGIVQRSPSIFVEAKFSPLYKYIKIKIINTTDKEAFGNAVVGLYYQRCRVWCWNIWYCPKDLSIIEIGCNRKKKTPERYEKSMAILSVPLGFRDKNHYNEYYYGNPFPYKSLDKWNVRHNTWETKSTPTPFHKKLITDPCPPGFKVPGKDLFQSLGRKLKKEGCGIILTDSGIKFTTDVIDDNNPYSLDVWSCNCPPQCININNKIALFYENRHPIIPCVE